VAVLRLRLRLTRPISISLSVWPMMVFPRNCTLCDVLTEENGFPRDRTQPSGRKSRCKRSHNKAAGVFYHDVRKPRREAALEAERLAEEKIRQREHKRRLKALRKEAEAGRRRQKALLAELRVEDVSREELSRRARAAGGLYIRGAG
jgi:hypothetical protein